MGPHILTELVTRHIIESSWRALKLAESSVSSLKWAVSFGAEQMAAMIPTANSASEKIMSGVVIPSRRKLAAPQR